MGKKGTTRHRLSRTCDLDTTSEPLRSLVPGAATDAAACGRLRVLTDEAREALGGTKKLYSIVFVVIL